MTIPSRCELQDWRADIELELSMHWNWEFMASEHFLNPQVVDVFAMPQSGTGVSVEAVDPVFQTKMLDMLKQCGR